MPLSIHVDGDRCWPDLIGKPIIETQNVSLAMLAGGMTSGAASVGIRIDLPDGRTVIAHVSQVAFDTAARAFRARAIWLAELERKGGRPS